MVISVRKAVFVALCILARLGHAVDTCPEVKIEGLSGSDKVTIIQTCPGVPGAKGDQGTSGLKGEKGSPGIVGKFGPAGEKGNMGAPGQSGPTGAKGDVGAPGLLGPAGAKGNFGAPGPAGPIGSVGSPGQPGFPGSKGDSGMAGRDGIPGTPGRQGLAGIKGDNGRPGFPGLDGDDGRPGFPGVKGEAGQPASTGERELENINCKTGAKDCKQLLQRGIVHDGWYTIYLKGCQALRVFCDMDTEGGGWIVFQRRLDGSVDFFREWSSYKRGFGNQLSEFWLGNDNIHKLTSDGTFELYIYLKDTDKVSYFAKYSSFKILSESEKYKLILGKFAGGSAGDSLTRHNGAPFSTRDRDNDLLGWSCALEYKGAWWYTDCHDSNLNGLYLYGEHITHANGINWKSGKGHTYSYTVSEMKIRPVK